MTLKIYKNTSYDDYKQEGGRVKAKGDTVPSKSVNRSRKKEFRSFLRHNRFFVLSMLLLGTSMVLIGHLLIVFMDSEPVPSHARFEEEYFPKVEIIKMPEVVYETSANDSVWECTDGSYITTPDGNSKCQKLPQAIPKQGGGNKFITRERVFSNE